MRIKVLITVFVSLFLVIDFCSAGEIIEDIDIGASMPFYSAYIWRAQTLVDNPVFQPAGYVSYKGFTFDFWSNWDVADEKEFTEIDYTWSYATDLGFITPQGEDILDKAEISGGYTFYTFPNLDEDDMTHEFFAGISLDTILSPSYTTYWDIDEGDGWYHEWGIGHTFEFDPISVDTGLSMGLNVEQWGYDTSLTALNFSTSVSVPLNTLLDIEPFKYVTLQPDIAYSLPLDSQYDHEVYGGVYIGIDI